MSATISAAVDIFDWSVDMLLAAFGWSPLSPLLVYLGFDAPPTVRTLTTLRVEVRRTAFAHAWVEQDGTILFDGPVPREGRIGITPMTPGPIRVRLTQEARDSTARHGSTVTETIFEPLPNGPPVDCFDAPASVALGERIACAWHAPRSERVRLAIIESGEVVDNIGPPTGQLVLPAARPGRVLLRLTAETSWGQTTLTRVTTVVAPELKLILLRPPVQTGCPGDIVRFEFKATAAESLWLIAPDADAPQRLQDKAGGFLVVRLGWRPAEFKVIARGYGGAERSIMLRAVPNPAACLETDQE